ncbi:MAG TPA: DUF4229 domain-containing protein [Candidatus Brachybacterium merdigallinarum]|nr:DUF4229 domain-containing protein [Candidatus Brachybacterium merdigallinarum]
MGRVLGYAVLRILMWLVLWYLLVLAGLGVYIAGVLAVLIAMMLSFLLLGRTRRRAAEGLQEVDERRRARRGPEVDEDAESEDALLDAADDDSSPGAASELPRTSGIADPSDPTEDAPEDVPELPELPENPEQTENPDGTDTADSTADRDGRADGEVTTR